MYNWPKDYPDQCPPENAEELSGVVFRFINKKTPTSIDFDSHYERNPDGNYADPCQARGLSVIRSHDDCNRMRDGVPALRKKKVAFADIRSSVGLIASTPSRTCQGHCTWWLPLSSKADVYSLFKLVDDTAEASND